MDQNDLLSLERTDLRWYQRLAVGTTPLGDFMMITEVSHSSAAASGLTTMFGDQLLLVELFSLPGLR